jgi:Spy/CpxP family protein refolding chaperone
MERFLGQRGARGQWWNNPVLAEKIKLTDDQRKAMDQILLQHRETLIDLRGGVEKAELGMEPLMREDQPNEAKILAQIDKVAQARAELEKANARFLLAIRAKLSPEQWKGLQAAHNDRMEHRDWLKNEPGPGGRRGPRPGFQPPGGPGGVPGGGPAGAPGVGPQGMLHDGPRPD